jgi:hypothetical protein
VGTVNVAGVVVALLMVATILAHGWRSTDAAYRRERARRELIEGECRDALHVVRATRRYVRDPYAVTYAKLVKELRLYDLRYRSEPNDDEAEL